MDAIVFLLVNGVKDWGCERFEAAHARRLSEMGIDPVAYRWSDHINLLPRPIPPELVKHISDSEGSWRCYVLEGDFLEKIEEEVNNWVDEWDVIDPDLGGLIRMAFLLSPGAIFAFEPQGEVVDYVYSQKNSDWVYLKIRSVLDRKEKLEGFIATGAS
ncbi:MULTISPECIES: hypothetical protein [Chromobacterium]|uniref:hypothetical protein n=1 Tax=Chromobacterium TaxID=535 RepID=UPI0013C2F60B|nr:MULTISPECIES: hypothetical protein [Chromobacterium]